MDAYIIDVLRTPGGRRKGRLADIHSANLGAVAVDALVRRSGADPAAVDDFIFGCISQVGKQSNHLARSVVMASMLGHPLGATGTRLIATIVHALRARGKRWGLQTICEGGGIANATVVEAL